MKRVWNSEKEFADFIVGRKLRMSSWKESEYCLVESYNPNYVEKFSGTTFFGIDSIRQKYRLGLLDVGDSYRFKVFDFWDLCETPTVSFILED